MRRPFDGKPAAVVGLTEGLGQVVTGRSHVSKSVAPTDSYIDTGDKVLAFLWENNPCLAQASRAFFYGVLLDLCRPEMSTQMLSLHSHSMD